MHSATTATGRPLPPPGKTLPKNRPAPLSCRAAHQLAAQKSHVTSQLQCYIPAVTDNHRRSPRKINRKLQRLENAISRRKQTLDTRSNRQFLQVSASHQRRIADADRPPQVPSNIVSNRQRQILEITVNLSKQTIAPRSNRHKNALLKCQKSPITIACHESPITSHASQQLFSEHSEAWLYHAPIGRLAFPGYG